MEASVYDQDNAFLVDSDSWECTTGYGSIGAVEAGSKRTIVILAKDLDGYVIFRGQKTIDIVAGIYNNAGTIDCTSFVSDQPTPASGHGACRTCNANSARMLASKIGSAPC